MKKILGTSAACACLLMSCNDSKMNNAFAPEDEADEDSAEVFVGDTLHLFEEAKEPPKAADMLFSDFFFNFIDDARFQLERVTFPLPYKQGEEVRHLTKKDWKTSSRFLDNSYYYVIYEREGDLELQKDTTLSNVNIEWYHLNEGNVEKCYFNRRHGKWMLTEIVNKNISDTPNAGFLEFYSRFVTDSIFQRESVANPLRLVTTSNDADAEEEERFVTPDEWMEMRADFPLEDKLFVNINYGQACISQNRKTLLLEGISNGMQTKFHFAKDDEEWKLVDVEY